MCRRYFQVCLLKSTYNLHDKFQLTKIVCLRPELKGASIVRELHVYGSAVPVSSKDPKKFQHHGFGTLLMEEAERITVQEHDNLKLAVISGTWIIGWTLSPAKYRNRIVLDYVVITQVLVPEITTAN